MARRRRVKRKGFISFFIFMIILIVGTFYLNNYVVERKEKKEAEELKEKERKKQEQLAKYNECLKKKYDSKNKSQQVTAKENAIMALIRQSNYDLSFVYEDINSGYSFSYQPDKTYYGASLIKLVDTIYILDKVNNGEMSLNDKVTYNRSYHVSDSPCMEKYQIGSEVTYNQLLQCALSVSDNTAHRALILNIGLDTLKTYGKSLGAKVILEGGDYFGNQTANDTVIYLKKLYQDFIEYPETGNVIKNYMTNTYFNYLDLGKNNIAHKYGYYNVYYHDIGIVYEDTPYFISVLTLHGKGDYEGVTKNVSKKINELHLLYQTERENSCKKEVYGK